MGIHIEQQLTYSTHIKEAIMKSNQILGMARRVYQYLDAEVMMYLYRLIRPTLAWSMQVVVQAPYLQKDIEAIHVVQRRAARLIPSIIKHLPYEDRLRKMHLPTLTYRCRGDMMQAYKYLHIMYTCSMALLPLHQSEERTTRGHSLKLLKPSPRLHSKQAFFSQRVQSTCEIPFQGLLSLHQL